MLQQLAQTTLSNQKLLEIIRFQTEVVQLGADLGSVMALVTERAQQLTAAHGAVVEMAEGDEMVYRAVSGIAEPKLGLRLQQGSSLSGYCVKAGMPVYCPDAEVDPRVDRDACRMVKLRSMIVVPLRHNDSAVGVLKVMSSVAEGFQSSDLQLLELMSDLIAAAMGNAVKYESDELFHRATHDTLTNLPNRALFYDHLHQRLSLARRAASQFGLFMIDMDGLKGINDTFGHRAGDAAIKEFASRMMAHFRESDTVARLGGDEFGVILSQLGDSEEAKQLIQRLLSGIRSPVSFEHAHLRLAASIGFALYPQDGQDINTLMEHADRAMYQMKQEHKAASAHGM